MHADNWADKHNHQCSHKSATKEIEKVYRSHWKGKREKRMVLYYDEAQQCPCRATGWSCEDTSIYALNERQYAGERRSILCSAGKVLHTHASLHRLYNIRGDDTKSSHTPLPSLGILSKGPLVSPQFRSFLHRSRLMTLSRTRSYLRSTRLGIPHRSSSQPVQKKWITGLGRRKRVSGKKSAVAVEVYSGFPKRQAVTIFLFFFE